MRIVILGWGSLIWDPRDLPREGTWQLNGPLLPIEFSRVSNDGRLTLAIDEKHGETVSSRYVLSPRTDVEDATNDLRLREGTTARNIGFVLSADDSFRCRAESVKDLIRNWGRQSGFDAVVWTDLAPNFEEETGKAFSIDAAESYLRQMPKSAADRAKKYIANAPPEVNTPLRRRLIEAH